MLTRQVSVTGRFLICCRLRNQTRCFCLKLCVKGLGTLEEQNVEVKSKRLSPVLDRTNLQRLTKTLPSKFSFLPIKVMAPTNRTSGTKRAIGRMSLPRCNGFEGTAFLVRVGSKWAEDEGTLQDKC
mmetsp:Transcript_47992/g.71502  ORF Transcript_47992/g.71502 Transcript_47992/m.71502 type:complete len:126 (-) Transcript_47992:100-477(-)